MLGKNWFRGIRKCLPLREGGKIIVKVANVHGRLLILENCSDLEKKKRTVRRYCFVVYPKLNGVDLSNEEEVNHFDGELADLVCDYAIINIKSAEMFHYIIPGIYKRYCGNLTFYSSRYI